MAEVAGVDPASITAWSQRSTQLREWAAHNLVVIDQGKGPSAAQLAAAQKATRPAKPEQLAWAQLRQIWREDGRGLRLDREAFQEARRARRVAPRAPFDRRRLAAMAETIEKAAFTRADLVELVGAQLPVDTERSPREVIEAAVDEIGMRLTGPRAAHQREGHERFTLDRILAEEAVLLDLVDARDDRAQLWITEHDTAGLSADQQRAVENIAASPWLVCPVSAPAGAGKTTSMRALVAAAHRSRRQVLVLAPTGKAVDVAVREGAGDTGYTVAKALTSLEDGTLRLDRQTLVVVDEAGMVGTDDLRQLLTATTNAGTKTVLVGDAHQLAPVKARGGMFAQLCTDLPWTQRLSEVWRMRDPAERTASLALRDGGPAPVRRAVDWYRSHDRLHTGDPIAMAQDALTAYRADVADAKVALLVCDTTEMADALNRRLHDDTVAAEAPTVTAGRGHRIGVGDLIISRRNDPTIGVFDATDITKPADPVRNGNRWRVYAIDTEHNRIAARRLDDGARAAFSGDYLSEQITHGYAVTVHSAQGVTADTTHAVLGETTNRALFYVAMTRGRASNTAYLYERIAGEGDHEHAQPTPGVHVARRGSGREAAHLVRAILANRDDQARTAHHIAAETPDPDQLPDRVHRLLDHRAAAVHARRLVYRSWCAETHERVLQRQQWIEQHISRSQDHGLEYGIDLLAGSVSTPSMWNPSPGPHHPHRRRIPHPTPTRDRPRRPHRRHTPHQGKSETNTGHWPAGAAVLGLATVRRPGLRSSRLAPRGAHRGQVVVDAVVQIGSAFGCGSRSANCTTTATSRCTRAQLKELLDDWITHHRNRPISHHRVTKALRHARRSQHRSAAHSPRSVGHIRWDHRGVRANRLVRNTFASATLASKASLSPSTAALPHRVFSFGCGTAPSNAIRQNRRQAIESVTSRHSDS